MGFRRVTSRRRFAHCQQLLNFRTLALHIHKSALACRTFVSFMSFPRDALTLMCALPEPSAYL